MQRAQSELRMESGFLSERILRLEEMLKGASGPKRMNHDSDDSFIEADKAYHAFRQSTMRLISVYHTELRFVQNQMVFGESK